MIEKPPLRLERYATMRAEIDAGAATDDVIGRAKISGDIWAKAQDFWQKRLAEDSKAKRTDTTKRYQALYGTKKRIFEKKLAILARQAAEPSLPAPTEPPIAPPETMPPPAAATPAFSTPVAAIPSAPVAPPLTSPPPVGGPIAPPMVTAFSSAPVASPPIAPPAFRQPASPSPSMPAMSADMEDEGGSTRILSVDVSQLLAQAKATPFQSQAPEMEEEGGSTRIVSVDMNQLLAQAKATPFQAAPPPSRPTATLPGEPPESQRSALPFAQAARAPEDGPKKKIFNINQFAALTAEIAESPATVADIRKRYGVTEAQHLEESQRWTNEFRENASLRENYLGIVRHYRDYLKKPGG